MTGKQKRHPFSIGLPDFLATVQGVSRIFSSIQRPVGFE